jgi:CubicO group peptidase (beta-lactamase class C family)
MRPTITATVAAAIVLSSAPLVAQTSPTGRSLSQSHYDGAIATAHVVLERFLSEAALPGLQVAVGVQGDIVWSESFGYADVENRVAVTPLTRFRIGSISKALTAAAMMTLVEAGLLDLDAPIRLYVPQFPDKGYPITARHLAGHLAGIRHYRDNEGISYRTYSNVVDALDLFAQDSLLHPPGAKYTYSSFGYNLLSAVIQAAAAEDFLTYLDRSVLQPLGMRLTVADHSDSIVPYRASFYRRDDQLLNARFTDNSYKWASGGFLSTAEDLVRFGSGLLLHRILKPESVRLLFTSQRTASGEPTGYGMGWRPREDWQNRPVVHHGGSSEGGRAFLLLYPDAGLIIALLANFNPAPLFEQEAQTLAHFFLEHPADTLLVAPPPGLRGRYEFATVLRDDSIAGTIELSGSDQHPGWMQWSEATPISLVAVDTLHGSETRIIGSGTQGLLNLWLSFGDGQFEGRWDWLGRTPEIRGSRLTHPRH